ncbi:MAG: DegT/DnrJ/EryC1/StrS family aminotransferase [Mycobacteriales bacterium]
MPIVDYRKQFRLEEPELMATIHEVLAGGDLILRHHLDEFERHLAEFVGAQEAVGVSNCTDALRLLAHDLAVGPGDEFVTVAHTFVATVSPFYLRGAEPVLVDVGSDHLMDPRRVAPAVTDRTKVVIPVHLNGRVCEMDAIRHAAAEVGAVVIEDAAQALGATYRGAKAGTLGWASVFSFYPAKLLGALGDAGAVVTDDSELAMRLRRLRDHGRVTKADLGGWGYNCRMDNLQAAVLDLRLRRLRQGIERRREIAAVYDAAFKDLPDVGTLPAPGVDEDRYDVFQNYPITVPDRDVLVKRLANAGVETLVSWPVPLHRQEALGLGRFHLPMTDLLSDQVVSLPIYPELEDWQVEHVAVSVHRACS